MRHLLAALVILAVSVPAAGAGGFTRARQLEPAAGFVARKPVTVWCAKSAAAWRSYLVALYGSDSGAHGSTVPGESQTRFDATVCGVLRSRLAGISDPASLAASIEVLTHESIHARGEADEGVTDCAAMHEMAGVAARFFAVKAGRELRALMAAAWAWHRDPRGNPAYRTKC